MIRGKAMKLKADRIRERGEQDYLNILLNIIKSKKETQYRDEFSKIVENDKTVEMYTNGCPKCDSIPCACQYT